MGDLRGRTALMASPEDVADTVMHVLTRPRHHRILDVAFRPVAGPSAG